MKKKYRSISTSITVVCLLFLILLGLMLAFVTYILYTNNFFNRYQEQMTSILNYVETSIDDDDMSKCAETFVESEQYKKTQEFFDNFVDHYDDLHFLYILKPMDPDDQVHVKSICSANSTYEKENEPENVIHLGDGEPEWYSEEEAEKLRNILNGDADVFFKGETEWGVDYTLARPLVNSKGEHYALLCVDVSLDNINTTIYTSIYVYIGILLFLSATFFMLLLAWMHYKVAKPIIQLEKSVVDFAATSHNQANPEDLKYIPPKIDGNNEITSLRDSVEKMSLDMKKYVSDKIKAEQKVHGLHQNISKMDTIAYHDALTGLRNKASYDRTVVSLDSQIKKHNATFALVMIDLNNLKETNDRYGHEKGDEYIKGTCAIIKGVYRDSQVYRVGGDEFVVILKGKDYQNRDNLLRAFRLRIKDAENNPEPWEKYSAAAGMAVYSQQYDTDTASVFHRADSAMYKEKALQKKQQ